MVVCRCVPFSTCLFSGSMWVFWGCISQQKWSILVLLLPIVGRINPQVVKFCHLQILHPSSWNHRALPPRRISQPLKHPDSTSGYLYNIKKTSPPQKNASIHPFKKNLLCLGIRQNKYISPKTKDKKLEHRLPKTGKEIHLSTGPLAVGFSGLVFGGHSFTFNSTPQYKWNISH